MTENEDFADQSLCIEFVQDPEMNLKLERAMLESQDYYFPYEEIAQMARTIQNENIVTSVAIHAMLRDSNIGINHIYPGVSEEEIMDVLNDKGIFVSDVPVTCPEAMPPTIKGFMIPRRILTRPAYRGTDDGKE